MVNIYIPNRRYSVECLEDSENYSGNEITILGNYSKSEYNATAIVSIYGISPTVRENHGQMIATLEKI